MAFKSHPIILFLDKNGFYIYQDTLKGILKLNFTPDIVSNSDVISKDKLTKLITTFVQTNKITPSSLAIVLSDDIIYVKELSACKVKTPPPQKTKKEDKSDNSDEENKPCEDETQEFLSNIPFENVLAKVIKTSNWSRAIGTNKDLIMAIADGFTNGGASLEIVIPAFVYGRNANFSTGLNSNNVKAILENTEALKSNNLLTDQKEIVLPQYLSGTLTGSSAGLGSGAISKLKKKKNIRQFVLIGIFIFLLVILVIVYFVSRDSEKPAPDAKQNIPSKTTLFPTAPPVSDSISTPSAAASMSADFTNIEIIINYPAGDTSHSLLKNNLSELGFQNIASEISQTSTQGKSSIAFSQDISVDIRTKIMEEVREILPGISILESQNASSTAKISIGKS